MTGKRIRKRIVFTGWVQGVGFRYRAMYKARGLGLTGWVKNLRDGSVEMEAEGQEEAIDALILYLDSQWMIRIERMDVRSIPLEEDRTFEIWED